MKFIVDEIVPEECPFFIDEEWVDKELYGTEIVPNVYFQNSCCRLAPYNLCKEEIYFDGCAAKSENGKCPFCITLDEYQKKKNIKKEKKHEKTN